MLKKIGQLVSNFSAFFFPAEGNVPEQQQHPEDYYQVVEHARRQWHDARQRFNQVSDPDLVDSAIFEIEAAEKRYIYLLKKAREKKVSITERSPSRG